MSVSRKDIRNKLAALLRGSLTLAPTDNIFAYQVGNFNGKSPVVYLSSSGTRRDRFTTLGRKATMYVNAHVLVLYASPTPDSPDGIDWHDEDAEDLLDGLESEIADALTPPASVAAGIAVNWSDRSDADTQVVIGGDTYLHEIIPLIVEAV